MPHSAQSTVPAADDASAAPRATTLSDGSQAIVRPNGQIISGYCEIVEWEESDGQVYRVSPEGQRRRAEEHRAVVRAFSAEVAAKRLTAARRRTPTTAPPRPRPRQHRAAATRRRRLSRSSSRSADPGDDDPHDDDGPGTFASFHRATPGLTGAERLRVFESLPEELREVYWENLARHVEGGGR